MSGDSNKRSFHGELKNKYLKVPEDGRIETVPFLEASQESVVGLLDKLGSAAFIFVKSDVNGNIEKLRTRYNENTERFKTLHDIVQDEIEREKTEAKNSATDALIWLVRGLYFMCSFVKFICEHDPAEESVQPCLQKAYEKTLKVHHAWLVQKAIGVSFKAAPYYSDLIKGISNGCEKDVLVEDINNYEAVLMENINSIHDYYTKQEIKEKPLAT